MNTYAPVRTLWLAPAAVAAVLLLASCGSAEEDADTPGSESPDQAKAEFNDTDVEFAQMMIPHHQQAVEMSRMAEERAGADVRELASEIEDAQKPEIDQFNGMLESWDEEPMDETGDMGDMDGMDHGDMDGMMTEEDMAQLEEAEGDAFDTMFLDMMIAHHEGAVDMAEDELDDGANPEAKDLAREIVDTQESEIDEMNGMLDDSGADTDDGSGDGGGHGGH